MRAIHSPKDDGDRQTHRGIDTPDAKSRGNTWHARDARSGAGQGLGLILLTKLWPGGITAGLFLCIGGFLL